MRKKKKNLVKTRENAQLKIISANITEKKLVKPNIIAALIYVFQNRNKN